eukprot:TRINITY_DN1768_c0_g1_i1.p2 TRINITY_DN1768_c0_g1~~TRINITY_DN1768_c0_g1_i1.p2  ORF type:complete len:342 (-),score=123.19 TRINITY_DN1768_c0_g1_i1:54-1079(-)
MSDNEANTAPPADNTDAAAPADAAPAAAAPAAAAATPVRGPVYPVYSPAHQIPPQRFYPGPHGPIALGGPFSPQVPQYGFVHRVGAPVPAAAAGDGEKKEEDDATAAPAAAPATAPVYVNQFPGQPYGFVGGPYGLPVRTASAQSPAPFYGGHPGFMPYRTASGTAAPVYRPLAETKGADDPSAENKDGDDAADADDAAATAPAAAPAAAPQVTRIPLHYHPHQFHSGYGFGHGYGRPYAPYQPYGHPAVTVAPAAAAAPAAKTEEGDAAAADDTAGEGEKKDATPGPAHAPPTFPSLLSRPAYGIPPPQYYPGYGSGDYSRRSRHGHRHGHSSHGRRRYR